MPEGLGLAEVLLARPLIETERLHLRLPELADVPALLAYYRENDARFKPTDPPRPDGFLSEAYWAMRVAQIRAEAAADRSWRPVLFSRAEPGRVVGTIGFSNIVRGPWHCCNLGYGLGGAFEGQGLMAEALRAAIAEAFGPLNLHRIQANYMPTNERSGALLRRLGFVVEGYARDYLLINGAWRDHVLTSLTNPAWRDPG